jgi:hypothetical protein
METKTYLIIAAIICLALSVLSLMLYGDNYELNGIMPASEYVHSQIEGYDN